MPRYMCTYFISNDRDEINKSSKRTRVVETSASNKVIDILVNEFNAKCVKMIRDLSQSRYYVYDKELHKLEQRNNFKLWLIQKE